MPAMRSHYRLNETQTETESPFGAAAVAPVETVPYIVQLLVRDTYARIPERNLYLVLPLVGFYVYLSARRCVFDCVIEQISQYLPYPAAVGLELKLLRQALVNRNALLFRHIAVEIDDVFYEGRYVHLLDL